MAVIIMTNEKVNQTLFITQFRLYLIFSMIETRLRQKPIPKIGIVTAPAINKKEKTLSSPFL
ncbi:hypothetical protein JTF06_02895 [Desemzia sp. RIT804]|uniref:hypothetical protein n=1 Tax=Desemzia sp. RIT 804 TaxID=2810209 RepID=UPI001950E53D|nr:hypothetical protein [Desemzia sp. RIT 804]MBM6613841.1 hypothetical protein [Desemzia sp. RIT 804]